MTLILFTTIVSYSAALLIERTTEKEIKKTILIISILLCLGVLFFFKYFNFTLSSLEYLASIFSLKLSPVTVNLLLPVGISFYTFQTLSYVIDVYRGDVKAERHLGYFLVFISFFPQLVAGPIERTKNLIPQIRSEKHFDYDQATYGLKLMGWGYFKKLVIADILSIYVSNVYDNPTNYQGFALVLATIFFTIQIYCDFSGYSDIAIGTAKLLGIDLMTNFKSPYFSQSIKEFWNRWHISLSTWFKDYLYIPMGGNRKGVLKRDFNLIFTFLISGLWHGANWTFVIWGGIHGIAQTIENHLLSKEKAKSVGVMKWIRILLVFLFCSFAWIFFVSNSFSDAIYVITNMFTGITSPTNYILDGIFNIGLGWSRLARLSACIFILCIYDYCSLKTDCIQWISNKNFFFRNLVYIVFIAMIIFMSATGETTFVYFQF